MALHRIGVRSSNCTSSFVHLPCRTPNRIHIKQAQGGTDHISRIYSAKKEAVVIRMHQPCQETLQISSATCRRQFLGHGRKFVFIRGIFGRLCGSNESLYAVYNLWIRVCCLLSEE